jgi:hypothetical protein
VFSFTRRKVVSLPIELESEWNPELFSALWESKKPFFVLPNTSKLGCLIARSLMTIPITLIQLSRRIKRVNWTGTL